MSKNKKTGLLILAGFALAISGSWADTLYLDNFDGDGKAPLIGSTPDVSSDGAVWTGLAKDPQWKNDGRIESADDQSCYVLLPFTPAPGTVYKLEVEVVRIGTTHRFDVGFLSKDVPAGSSLTELNDLASPWMRLQANGEVWAMTTRSGGVGQLAKVNASRTHTLQIILDTTGDVWTAAWSVDGNAAVTQTYKKNPEIRYVGFGRFRQGTFHVSRFELSEITGK